MIRTALMLLLFASCITTSKLPKSYPDEMVIYHLYPLRTSFVSIPCEKVKDIPDVKTITVKDRREIKKQYELFVDKRNFQIDTSIADFDARVFVLFSKNGIEVKHICWSNVNRCQLNGAVYLYNEKVEKFFMDYALIFKK